ncbi:MAG: potassium channel family protein [Actinomycetota bacterium]
MLGVILVYGVVGYMGLENWSFTDALYMTVMTLTTVGYKEVHPLDTSGRYFTMTLIVMGVTLLFVTVSLAASEIFQRDFGERARRRRMQRQIDQLRDHFIVCAFGRVGRAVSHQLREEGVPFVVLDRDEELEERMIDEGVLYLVGDPTQQDTLLAAGIDRARAIVTAVDSDPENVYITLAARALNEDIFVVARAAQGQTIDRLYRAGADRVVSPYRHSGRQMAMLAVQPKLSDYLEVQISRDVTIRVDEVVVDETSGLVGKTVRDALDGKTPLALRKASGGLITPPSPEVPLAEGDVLLLLRDARMEGKR